MGDADDKNKKADTDIDKKIEFFKFISETNRKRFESRKQEEWRIFLSLVTFFTLTMMYKLQNESFVFQDWWQVGGIFVVYSVLCIGCWIFFFYYHRANDKNKTYAHNAEKTLQSLINKENIPRIELFENNIIITKSYVENKKMNWGKVSDALINHKCVQPINSTKLRVTVDVNDRKDLEKKIGRKCYDLLKEVSPVGQWWQVGTWRQKVLAGKGGLWDPLLKSLIIVLFAVASLIILSAKPKPDAGQQKEAVATQPEIAGKFTVQVHAAATADGVGK